MIGVDIVHIPRVEDMLKRKKVQFLNRIFSLQEQEDLKRKKFAPKSVAGYFAAKEAISKSTGLGLGKMGIREIQIFRHPSGQPYGFWKGEKFHISISHEKHYVVAIAKRLNEKALQVDIPEGLKSSFPIPKKEDHKGDRGKAAFVAGSRGMLGAPCLAGRSALRSGCGYSYIMAKREIADLLSVKVLEEIVKDFSSLEEEFNFLKDVDAIGIGPGMGLERSDKERFFEILKLNKPMVIDGDGLNHLSENLKSISGKNTRILTPHEGEMARILGINSKEVRGKRKFFAKSFAKIHNSILILKGNDTIVTDGKEVYINKTGNPGMATAGSGDVLTGIITSLLSQGLDGMKAAKLGVYLHGLSGDLAVQDKPLNSLVASDIIEYLPKAMRYFLP